MIIGVIHRFSRLVTLLFLRWLHVRFNHKDVISNVNLMTPWIIKLWQWKHWSLTSTARVILPVRTLDWVDEHMQNKSIVFKSYEKSFIMEILRNTTAIYNPYYHVPWFSLCMFRNGVYDVRLFTLQYWLSSFQHYKVPVFR